MIYTPPTNIAADEARQIGQEGTNPILISGRELL